MPQLPIKAFAQLAQKMAGAADDEIIQAARALSGDLGTAAKRSVQEILESGEDFGILSAANPGRTLSPEENLTRHGTLLGRVREMGYEPLEQQGVYGGAAEPSLLVPGMNPDHTKLLGREFGQEAVISARGWHRLADDAEFPRSSVNFPDQVDDYYSEIVDPATGQPRRYQLGFPDEAFQPAPSAAPSGDPLGLPSGGSGQSAEAFPPSQSTTPLAEMMPQQVPATSPLPQAAPAAPRKAPAVFRADPELIKGLGNLAKGLQKTDTPGVYRLHPQIHARVQQIFEHGVNLPNQSDWSGGENVELLQATGGIEEAARLWARLFGATSPGTSVPVNTRESLSAFRHHLVSPDQPMTTELARSMDPVITMAGSKVPSINNAYADLELTKPKPEELAKLMVGKEPGTPLDVHAIWGMGSTKDTFDKEIPDLRTFMTEAEGLPQKGGLTNRDIYYRTADALTRSLNEIAPEMAHNPRFATFWEGVRGVKGLKHQGGPIDILRKKGLLKEAALLDPGKLRQVLKTSGWTAGAIAAVLKASSAEAGETGKPDIKKLQLEADARMRRESRDPNYPSEPRLNTDEGYTPVYEQRPSTKLRKMGLSREGDIELPSSVKATLRAKTAAKMNKRVYRPKPD